MIRLKLEPVDEGGYVATSPDLQGLVAQGATIAETLVVARDVARKIIESCLAHGDPLPRPKRRRARCVEAVVPVTVVA
ncbi:MAG: type II toxin-antitoxin system HicB family antitoxin [Planctomycetota bacterium]